MQRKVLTVGSSLLLYSRIIKIKYIFYLLSYSTLLALDCVLAKYILAHTTKREQNIYKYLYTQAHLY